MRGALIAVCCLTLFTTGCATRGGVAVEGRASQVKPPPSTPPPVTGALTSADTVSVLRADPKVNDKVKGMLKPCPDGRYPLDQRYLDLTQDGAVDLIATVQMCLGKAPAAYNPRGGIASYIYDLKTVPPAQLLAVEESAEVVPEPSYGVMVVRSEYQASDRSCCPSGKAVAGYRWNGTAFEEQARK